MEGPTNTGSPPPLPPHLTGMGANPAPNAVSHQRASSPGSPPPAQARTTPTDCSCFHTAQHLAGVIQAVRQHLLERLDHITTAGVGEHPVGLGSPARKTRHTASAANPGTARCNWFFSIPPAFTKRIFSRCSGT